MSDLSQAASLAEVAELTAHLAEVQKRIVAACGRANRSPEEICLIGVSKTHATPRLIAAYDAGLRVFGENRVQEAQEKFPLPAGEKGEPRNCVLHLIGPLQKNKVRKAIPICAAFHGVDSIALWEALGRVAAELDVRRDIYLQVNTSREPQKSGFTPEDLGGVISKLLPASHLRLVGLMTMGPSNGDLEATRLCFRELKSLLHSCQAMYGGHFPHLQRLSMGMSGDFEMAIEEGAHDIRVGTALLGHRDYR